MRTELVIDALTAAERTRGSLAGAIFHADHGAQYTSKAFAAACAAAGVRQSMSAVGSSADNALAESFNATFKRETLQGRRAFTDERQARLESLSLAAPLQHRPTPLPARIPVPDQLREEHPNGASYAGASRINPVSKIKGQGPHHLPRVSGRDAAHPWTAPLAVPLRRSGRPRVRLHGFGPAARC
jgi:Integrase core domain